MSDQNTLNQSLLASPPSRTPTQNRLFNQTTLGAVQDHERTREVLDGLGDDGAALFREATQAGQGIENALAAREASKGEPTIQKEYTAVFLIFLCLTMLFFSFVLVAEFSFNKDFNQGGFCGEGGIRIWTEDGLTECFVLLVLYCPVFLLTCFLAFISMVVYQPWAKPQFTGQRPPEMQRCYRIKMICGLLYLLCAIVRMILIATSDDFFTSEETKGVDVTEDILQLVGILIVLPILVMDNRSGHGHDYYIRLFVVLTCVQHAVLIIVRVGNSQWKEVAQFVLSLVMSATMLAAWYGHPKFEDVGLHDEEEGERSVPPWSEFWPLISPFKGKLYAGFIFSVGQALLYNYSIIESATLMKGGAKTRQELNDLCQIFVSLSLGVAILRCICQNLYGVVGQRSTLLIKNLMFSNFMRQDASFLHKKENATGTLVSRLNTDTEIFGQVLTMELQEMMKPFFQTALGLIMVISISWRLSVVFFCLLIFLMICMLSRSVTISASLSRKYSDALSNLSARGLETLKGIEAVHQYQQENNEIQVYWESLLKTYAVAREKVLKESFFKGYEAMLLAGIQAVTLWYGGVLVFEGQLDENDLLQFALIAGVCIKGCDDIDKGVPIFMSAVGSAVRVCDMIYNPHADVEDETNGYTPPPNRNGESSLKGKIEFRNITFRYPGSTEVMKPVLGPGLNFTIQPGESCAFVGESGCGKSTTVSIIARDYHIGGLEGFKNPIPHDDRDRGLVLLDDVDIRSYSRPWLLKQIGVVAQASVIFNTTVEENVAYGLAERRFDDEEAVRARRGDVIAALTAAAAWNEFVNKDTNPNNLGLDYMCGQDGCNLSGGQKQRVSIARMIYKKPSLFIFDEVTSALDAGSEKKVMDTLKQISTGHTNFLVAHRLNTIKHANNIIVLRKGGTIIEAGHHPTDVKEVKEMAHDQLLANRSAYFELFSKQTF